MAHVNIIVHMSHRYLRRQQKAWDNFLQTPSSSAQARSKSFASLRRMLKNIKQEYSKLQWTLFYLLPVIAKFHIKSAVLMGV